MIHEHELEYHEREHEAEQETASGPEAGSRPAAAPETQEAQQPPLAAGASSHEEEALSSESAENYRVPAASAPEEASSQPKPPLGNKTPASWPPQDPRASAPFSPPRRLLLCNNHGEPRRLHTRPPEEARQGLEALPYLRPLIATNIRHIRRDPIILLEALGEISPINRLREQEAKEPGLRHPATDGIPAFPGLRVSPGVPSGEEKPSAPCSYPSGLCFL